jgi:hypothetical protein
VLDPLHLAVGLMADVPNPLEAVTPSLGPFAPLLDAKWKQLLGLAWFFWLLYAVWHLLRAIGEASSQKKMGAYGAIEEARGEISKNVFVLAGLVAAPALVAGVITFAS